LRITIIARRAKGADDPVARVLAAELLSLGNTCKA